jgi:hypothetical protein
VVLGHLLDGERILLRTSSSSTASATRFAPPSRVTAAVAQAPALSGAEQAEPRARLRVDDRLELAGELGGRGPVARAPLHARPQRRGRGSPRSARAPTATARPAQTAASAHATQRALRREGARCGAAIPW